MTEIEQLRREIAELRLTVSVLRTRVSEALGVPPALLEIDAPMYCVVPVPFYPPPQLTGGAVRAAVPGHGYTLTTGGLVDAFAWPAPRKVTDD